MASQDPFHDRLSVQLGIAAPVDAVGAAVRAAAIHAGLEPERATRLRVVVEELVRESCRRERVGDADQVELVTTQQAGRFGVEVRDRALPIDPATARRLPSRRLAAMGFVDHLHVASHGEHGNVAAVEVQLRPDGAEHLGDEEVLGQTAERVDDDVAAALEVGPLAEGQEVGVARCVYRCYGYSYLDPIMYRPALLRRAVRTAALHPVVATTPDGEVVAHCALTFEHPDDPVPEGGKLVVDPRYRGHHLAERLAAERARVAARLGVPGIWFECVTNHPFSQREVLAGGGFETGLLIGATPATVHMEDLGNTAGGRHALVAMWSPVAAGSSAPGRSVKLHVPDRHVEMLRTLVERSGLERDVVGAASGPASGGRSLVRSSFSRPSGVARLRVDRVGAELVERVRSEIDALEEMQPAVVHLDLDVGDPATAWAVEQLESLGFSWAAWLPGFVPASDRSSDPGDPLRQGSDAVRLQRIEDRHLELGAIECARAEGEQLRDLVLGEWRRVGRGRGPPARARGGRDGEI